MAETCTTDRLLRALTESPEFKVSQSPFQQLSFDVNQMIHTFLAMQQSAPSPSNIGYTAYLEVSFAYPKLDYVLS